MNELILTPGFSPPNVSNCLGMNIEFFRENWRGFSAGSNLGSDLGIKTCPYPSSHILGSRYGLQVVGIDTSLVSAQMINLKPVGDGADKLFVRNNMSDGGSSIGESDLSVVGIRRISSPPIPTQSFVPKIVDDVVTFTDRSSLRTRKWSAEIAKISSTRSCLLSANNAVSYFRHWVSSLVEVARGGWRKRFPLAPSYTQATTRLKGGRQ